MNVHEFRQSLELSLLTTFEPGETQAIIREIVLHLTGEWPPYAPELCIHDSQQKEAELILSRILNGEPMQYVLGKVLFRGMDLLVNPAVLIPRPETAELPDLIREEINVLPESIIDLGTGSGCIAISLGKIFPAAIVRACDVSLEALQTAADNALLNGVRIDFFWSDMNDEEFLKAEKKYDLIVSNPPYISSAEAAGMDRQVLEHEPHLALFAPADDPLHFYRRIAVFALGNLKEQGSVWLEINPLYADETSQIFKRIGMHDVRIYSDLSGKDRFIAAWI
jgi:release factor glutamine methyltransferase